MTPVKKKCIVILSDKSSGSSALQYRIEKFPDVKLISKTRHSEKETLFWTKAASILDLPQVKILDSEVPISKENALEDLNRLLLDNLPGLEFHPKNHDELIFGGWERLCHQFTPVFLEKSPHHLHQLSALELLQKCTERLDNIDFLFIGLIRNPMDTLYSQWRRWKAIPEKTQYQWKRAYENLLRFRDLVEDKLIIIRYEDLIDDNALLEKISEFVEQPYNREDRHFHSRSLQKWSKDPFFGFQLSPQVRNLAVKFGYRQEDMMNSRKWMWPVYRAINRNLYSLSKPFLFHFSKRLRKLNST